MGPRAGSAYSGPDISSPHPNIPFFKNDLNIITQSALACSKWSPSLSFPMKPVCAFLFFPKPCPSHPLHLNVPIIYDKDY